MNRVTIVIGLGVLVSLSLPAQEVVEPAGMASNTTATAFVAPEKKNPLVLWQDIDGSPVKLTASGSVGYFNQDNSWFGNAKDNIGGSSDIWIEGVFHPGIEGSLFLDQSELYGRMSVVYGITSSDLDAPGTNAGGDREEDTRLEDAYIGWGSGDLFSVGKDLIDASFGRQHYMAGTGFLFHSQASNGRTRGAYWIGERKAADYAGILTLNVGKFKSDLIYLKADDNPSTDTKAGGITLDYASFEGDNPDTKTSEDFDPLFYGFDDWGSW